MPFFTTWLETADSRPATVGLSQPTATLKFVGKNFVCPDDDTDANLSLQAIVPLVFPGGAYTVLTYQSYKILPKGNGLYEAEVTYGRQSPLFTFEIAGGQQKITQSLETIQSYAPEGEMAPDFQGAIGVDGDKVNGVDISVPTFAFEITIHVQPGLVTQAYILSLANLAWTVNTATFYGFDPGEVLFVGVRGSQRGLEDVELTYKFQRQPTKYDIQVGDITVTQKDGWEYLWILYANSVDATANVLVKVPSAAYVERVYEYGDFSILGIG